MKLKYEFVIQPVADGYVAVSVGNADNTFSGMIRLNETGAFIMQQLQDEVSATTLVERMINKYHISRDDAEKAVNEFVNQLKKAEIVV